MDRTQLPPSVEDDPGDVTSSPRPELLWTKLVAPAPRAGLLPRAGVQSLLQSSLQAKLCLVAAPAGSGKTTLLAQWRAVAGGGRVAWVSLEEADNDPTRFWSYLVAALRTVEPGVGTVALEALGGPSVELERVVVPSLVNDLATVGALLLLVLDDYHLITDATCHQTLGWFLDHLPAEVHVVLSTRLDPPLPLARMRARGELAEVRVGELQFTGEEAAELLNGSMGLALAAEDVARLAERTEGWAAGLVLAGLSLRGRPDYSGFIAAFSGGDRHVADYLVAEVLERQPPELREFLLRTSVLERLSGPLCDVVLETQGSAELLGELEASNLFVMPLDDRRQWYRYHQLFAQLLRLQLGAREPTLVPVLHRRAAAWHRQAGNVDEAIGHASAAGDLAEAGALIARHWATHWLGGQRATVARWLEGLPEAAIMADPPVALITAWSRGFQGASKQDTERWLAAAEDEGYGGPPPDGMRSQAFGAALARATLMFDDVGRSAAAARRALELAGDQPAEFSWAGSALGQALYLAGQAAEARPWLEDLVSQVPASVQPYAVVTALAVLSLLAGDADDPGRRLAGPWRGGNCRGTRGQLRAAEWDRLPGPGTGAGPPGRARRGRGTAGAGAGTVRGRQHGPAPHLRAVGARVGASRSRRPARRSGAGRPGPRAGRTVDGSWHAPLAAEAGQGSAWLAAPPASADGRAVDGAGAGSPTAAAHPAVEP